MSRAPQRRPNKAITQTERLSALRTMLVLREKWPPDAVALGAFRDLHPDLVNAEIAAEDIRRSRWKA